MSDQRPIRVAMNRVITEMVELAQRYCELIEASGPQAGSWLQDVAEILPRLHAAVMSLDWHIPAKGVTLTPDLDARFEIYSYLRDLLGERDGYWLEFDRVGDSHAMTGSLADDLTDIYCELKHGLRTMDIGSDRAVQGWLTGFTHHWGQHLADAHRHLSLLASQGRLE